MMTLRNRFFFTQILKKNDVVNRTQNSVVVLLRRIFVCCGMCSIVGRTNGNVNEIVSHVHGIIMGMSMSAGRPMDLICIDESHSAPEIGRNRLAIPRPRNMSPIEIESGPMSCAIIISGTYKTTLGIIE